MSNIIEMKNICKSYGSTQVLHHIDFSVQEGEVVVIIGPSGSGKSTLIRCINCLEMISSGEMIVDKIKIPERTEPSPSNPPGSRNGFPAIQPVSTYERRGKRRLRPISGT